MALRVRPMTAEEVDTIQRLAHSRPEPARTVERACMMWLAHQGQRVAVIAQELRLCQATVRAWLKRFNRQGLAGLQEAQRPGRPATYTPEQVSEVIATCLTKPQAMGLPFASWTLDRLAAYLQEVKGMPIKRSRINELLLREGLRWRTQETWFGERVDPAFAEKRGSSRPSTLRPRRAVSSCAWMRWVPKAPRASRGRSWCRLRGQPCRHGWSPYPPPPRPARATPRRPL